MQLYQCFINAIEAAYKKLESYLFTTKIYSFKYNYFSIKFTVITAEIIQNGRKRHNFICNFISHLQLYYMIIIITMTSNNDNNHSIK